MEAATLTLSSTLQIDPFRLFTCTGHKPTITINPRKRTMTLFPHGHLQVIMCGHKSRHVAHAVRAGREMNGDDDGKRARGVVGPTVVLACVLGTMCLTLPMCRPSLANAANWPFSSWSAQEEKEVTRAKLVRSTLNALMEMEGKKSVTINTEEAQKRFEKFAASISAIVPPERKVGRAELKEAARKFVLSGKTVEAVDMLKRMSKYPPDKPINEETYICSLVLVEMFLYQGKYDKAKTLVEELEQVLPSDPDPKLYKAVIYLMLGYDQRAKESWAEYDEKLDFVRAPPLETPGDDQSKKITFDEFKGKIIRTEGRW